MENKSVMGYVVFNFEGIPMRYDGEGITHDKAVHYAALITDYLAVSKKIISKTLRDISINP